MVGQKILPFHPQRRNLENFPLYFLTDSAVLPFLLSHIRFFSSHFFFRRLCPFLLEPSLLLGGLTGLQNEASENQAPHRIRYFC